MSAEENRDATIASDPNEGGRAVTRPMDPAETGRDGDIGPLPLAAEEVIAQMNSGELSIGPAAVIAGQPKYAENEIRKDFTPEERGGHYLAISLLRVRPSRLSVTG